MEKLSLAQKFWRSVVVFIILPLPLAACLWAATGEDALLQGNCQVLIALILPITFLFFGFNLLKRAWKQRDPSVRRGGMEKIPDFLMGLVVFIVVTIACFTPTEFYLFARYLFRPRSFWDIFFLTDIAAIYVIIGGLAQFFLFLRWKKIVQEILSPEVS